MGQTLVSESLLNRLMVELDGLTPEARKAARYALENPRDMGFLTVREFADVANVKPNTIVRMAQQVGFEGYDDFREPFREAIRTGQIKPQDRARWLQNVQKRGEMGQLYADMVNSALDNLEKTFAGIKQADMTAAAKTIWSARNVYTLGVGVHHSNVSNFTYLASTGMAQFYAIPQAGSTAIDDLAWATEQDVLIAITSRPYRNEVVTAARQAKKQGATLIALSDSPASPIARIANHSFTIAVETPQFFPSSVSTLALLETLLSFVIATASDEVVARVQTFHDRRKHLGFYYEDPS